MIGSFGDITFEVPLAPETAEHSKAADEVSFTIRLRRRWMDTVVNVGRELETLRGKVDADEPERLLVGPDVLGRYVLTAVDTTYVRASEDRIDAADVDLTFEEYN